MRRVIDHSTRRLLGLAASTPYLEIGAVIKYRRRVYKVLGYSLSPRKVWQVEVRELDRNTPADMRLHDLSPRLGEMAKRLARKYPPKGG